MSNKLVLYTFEFPFGSLESYLETEINYLSEAFEEILIIPTELIAGNSRQRIKLPKNCFAKPIDVKVSKIGKVLAVFYFFHPLFWKEFKIIKNVYKTKLNTGIVSTILISLYRATKIKKHSESIVLNTPPSTKLFFYSYWCNDCALNLALLQKKYPAITCFSRLHRWDLYFEQNKLNYLPFRHYIADNLKAVFSISENGKYYCKEIWKINDPDKIKISGLGVISQSKVEVGREFILVSCSNVVPTKRIDLIIDALRKLNDLTIRWVHFGDGSEMEEMKKLAEKYLNKNIRCEWKGWVANTEVLKWYAANHPSLLINVSSSEGIPVSIMEAMSFGIPVIATDVGGSREIVNQENGLLLPSDPTIDEVAAAIKTFFYLTKEQKRIKAENAWSTWNEKYNSEKNYTSFIKAINKL